MAKPSKQPRAAAPSARPKIEEIHTSDEEDEGLEIPEDEAWRLVGETGILDGRTMRTLQRTGTSPEDDEKTQPELILDTFLLTVPLLFLFTLMDILVRQQYSERYTFLSEAGHVASVAPVVAALAWFSTIHKTTRAAQALLFFTSMAVGIRLIYLVNHDTWHRIIQQAPPLCTIWVLTVWQLDLAPAVISLAVVAVAVQYLNLKIII